MDALPSIVQAEGYPDVQTFTATYRKAEAVVSQHNRELAEWERKVQERQRPAVKERPPEPRSVRERCGGCRTRANGNSHSHTGGQLTGTADDRERRRYGAIHSGGVHKQEPVCRLYTVLCAIIFLKIFVQIRSADLLYI